MKNITIFLLICLAATGLKAQTAKTDTTKKSKKKLTARDSSNEVIMLKAVYIKGEVDKPGVSIIPKRISSDLKERQLSRSFDKEAKKDLGSVVDIKRQLRKVDRIKSIKKVLDKERDKKKKEKKEKK